MNLMLYELAERGDTNQLQSKLRFLTFSSVDTYDRVLATQPVTNAAFARRLNKARAIATQVQTQLVSLDMIMKRANERTNAK